MMGEYLFLFTQLFSVTDKIEVSNKFQDSDCLKVKTEIICDNSGEKLVLRFPKSRIDRENFPQKIISNTNYLSVSYLLSLRLSQFMQVLQAIPIQTFPSNC